MEADRIEALPDVDAEAALGALAHGHRLAIYRLLARSGETGVSAGGIAAELGLPNSSLSFHLAHLVRAGLARQERRSRSLIYTADDAAMRRLLDYLIQSCRSR